MPITAQTPINNYTANGSVTVFNYTYKILSATDLKVYLNGVLQTTGYTVSGIGLDVGGSVTFSVAPANTTVVRLQRLVTKDRSTDYVEGGALPANTLDNDFDRAIMQIQDLDLVAFKEDSYGNLNASGRVITNAGTPVNTTDLVTKAYVDVTIPANVAAAATSATNAANSATAAASSASAASTSATNSANSATASANSAAASAASAANQVPRTSTTGSAVVPSGTTAQRDTIPTFGYLRGNSDLTQMEWWNGTAWTPVGSGATGGLTDHVFYENDTTITQNYTITAGKNAMSAGPITINTGVTVTVPTGSVWTIV